MGAKKTEGYAKEANRKAFEDVIGDPFTLEDKLGAYNKLKQRGFIGVMDYSAEHSGDSPNAARPSELDFYCDVERVVCREMEQFTQDFWLTFREGIEDRFTAEERFAIVQKLGRLFRKLGISPTSKYFTTVRRRTP